MFKIFQNNNFNPLKGIYTLTFILPSHEHGLVDVGASHEAQEGDECQCE